MREHTLIEVEDNTWKIKFTNPPFNDIIFSFGKVQITEKDDSAVLSFDYKIFEGTVEPEKQKEFEKELGDFLVYQMEDLVSKNLAVYSGGVDE